MKVAIAAWHLKDFNVGLGRYCRQLIEALGRVDHDNLYEVLSPVAAPDLTSNPNFRYRRIRYPLFKRRVWEQTAPLLAGPHDVLHLPYDSCVAWKRGKLVTSVHDMKPMLFDTGSKGFNMNTIIERWIVRDKWTRIDHVITLSESSRRDIQRFTGLPQNRIAVVPPGVDLDRFRPLSDEVRASSRPGRPYVLCVAGSDPTKNLETLIDAFARLHPSVRTEHDLVLVGDLRRRPELPERVRAAGIAAQTRFIGMVDDSALVRWYQEARLFVFPSRYEGFGLPVLEAMACGCPVVCSNTSSLPEAAGSAAVLVDPSDTEGMAAAMTQVLRDGDLHERLRSEGLVRAAAFTWDRTARQTVAVYRETVGMS